MTKSGSRGLWQEPSYVLECALGKRWWADASHWLVGPPTWPLLSVHGVLCLPPHVSSPHRGAVFQEAKESLCSPSFYKVCPVSTGAVFWLLQFFSCVGAQRQQTQAPEFRENRAWTLTATELSLSAAQLSSHGGRTKWGSAATLLWTPAHLAAAPAGGGGSSARASVTCAGQRQAPLDLESATMSPVLAGNRLLTGQWSRLSRISRVPQKDWGGQVNDHP